MLKKIQDSSIKIAVIGLGYVGLPLAVQFGKKFDTIGFEKSQERLSALQTGIDATGETTVSDLQSARHLRYSNTPQDLRDRDIFIVAVPTPIDRDDCPDLDLLLTASAMVGKVMKPGAIVIYESTVYPGCTEEECVPVLARESKMTYNRDFFCGYSPERINPGDPKHTLINIQKITSGSTQETAEIVDSLYHAILQSGTFRASSIKVAETAKVVENSQRDINIAFVNEVAKICHLTKVDTLDVLTAAGTKWNFLPFKPGLVGGHCIAVAPHYLAYKAKKLGYHPDVILAGRRINDSMAHYVAAEIVKLISQKKGTIAEAKILQLGITFKEHCNDIRNSRAADIARELTDYGCRVSILDPCADPAEVQNIYSLDAVCDAKEIQDQKFDAIVLTVAHSEFAEMDLAPFKTEHTVVYDVKGLLPATETDGRL